MKNIVIVGSGAVAAELTNYIEDAGRYSNDDNRWNILGYLDAQENVAKYWAKYKLEKPVLGDVHSFEISTQVSFVVGISNIPFRKQMLDILRARGAHMVSFIHPGSIISKTAVLGNHNIIYPFCIVGPNVIIGDDNLFTSYSFISHDCRVGDNNFFSTAGLSGNVKVGDGNFFGIRSTVLPNLTIGNRNTIQAGMTVDKPILNDSLIFHRFKEKVISITNPANDE